MSAAPSHDLVAIDAAGRTVFAKSLSTPQTGVGVMAGLDELAGVSISPVPGCWRRRSGWCLAHGRDQRAAGAQGRKVALLTTEGHRDVLEMREGLKGNRYICARRRRRPLVPRELRFACANGSGRVERSQRARRRFPRRAIARSRRPARPRSRSAPACLSQSRARDRCCRTAGARAARRQHLALQRVLPQIKEYERVSTTVVNAYVQPIVRHYLGRLEQRLIRAASRARSSSSSPMAACAGEEAARTRSEPCCRDPRAVHVRLPALWAMPRHPRSRRLRHGRHLDGYFR